MFDRPSFDPRYSHGQQAGGSSIRPHQASNGIPAMFLPNYSGDGQGRIKSQSTSRAQTHVRPSGDGEMPRWSGDGRRNVANPLMPVYQADGSPSFGPRKSGRTQPPQVLPISGDGRGSVDLSRELSMTVNGPAHAVIAPAPARKAKKTSKKRRTKRSKGMGAEVKSERSEMWKLVALVVVFLIWISTASTLLFLYMDRYLFP